MKQWRFYLLKPLIEIFSQGVHGGTIETAFEKDYSHQKQIMRLVISLTEMYCGHQETEIAFREHEYMGVFTYES